MQDFKDKELTSTTWSNKKGHVQGEYETLHPSVHLLWHREEDLMVPAIVQRYIAENLPWIQYHELKGSVHLFPYLDGISDTIIKSLLGAK
ncbi:hypothetical protein AHAS_Ahas11G0156400 [Arachis hypogaea]